MVDKENKFNISATRYSTYSKCRLMYYYKYIIKLYQVGSSALEIGSQYHHMLEAFHLEGEEGARRIIESNDEHRGLLERLLAKYMAQPILGTVIATEKTFKIKIPQFTDVYLHGIIDRLDEDKIVEYKTSSRKWKQEDVDNIQTDFYLYAALKTTGNVLPMFYSVNNKNTKMPAQIIIVEKTEDEILRLEDKIAEFVNDLKISDFSPNPGAECFMCPWGNKGDSTCSYSL